ncbi:phosphate/phosphite/phosphonate ABC transporter substrate-binding protein [Sulfuriflexus mobilis]|uniref:phosphate/phosphite/phosphonate ABC transporter substrate-binding protein n=1 Tax=Sulfuriflexus mobilis TaxID=1811807 RepID=UPI00155875A6|nr:phosphate/phosphite/phosphonate ABC transporter substrate-binding protein [Sulfuriflexus mobilis]
MMKKIITLMITAFCLHISLPAFAEIKVGVMAPRGALKTMKQWGELGTYLQSSVGSEVKIVPLKANETVDAVLNGAVDYMLTNPVLTVIMEKKQAGTPIATLNRKSGSQFAGVIIAKKGSGITKGTDLKGKKVMAFKFRRSAAAYVFQVKHLIDQGIDPHKDFASFKEAKKQDDIVLAVKAGLVDAGFIKSGLLETMAKEGKINMDDFEIVDKQTDSLKHVHSTILYPEWYMSASVKADAATTAKLKVALLKLNAGDKASQSAGIVGFADALSLNNLDATLKSLKLPPYE